MGTLQQIRHWSLTHHPRWLVVLRVALGLCLFIKGVSFMANLPTLQQMLQGTFLAQAGNWLPIFITWAHILGGFLIIIGMMTRWAVLLQIPILLGAVLLINLEKGWLAPGSELPFSLVILALLVFFLVEGGGPVSMDDYLRKNPK